MLLYCYCYSLALDLDNLEARAVLAHMAGAERPYHSNSNNVKVKAKLYCHNIIIFDSDNYLFTYYLIN
jgi:hypothetical protein